MEFRGLQVYRKAVDFVAVAEELAARLPPFRSYLADQLRRAAASITLNIAEGAGEFSARDKARFYRIARRSATECAGLLSILERLKLGDPATLASGFRQLDEIAAMLTRMTINLQQRKP